MKSVNNIWKISDKGGKPVQVTHHTSGNLFFPSMSADGKTIVYEENFGLWKLDVATGKSTEIRIDIKSDTKENDSELRTITNEAQGFSLSPSTNAPPSSRTAKFSRSPPSAAKSSASPKLPGAKTIRNGRQTASGSPSSPIDPAAKKSISPMNSATISKKSATPIAINRSPLGARLEIPSLVRLRPQAPPCGSRLRQDRCPHIQ